MCLSVYIFASGCVYSQIRSSFAHFAESMQNYHAVEIELCEIQAIPGTIQACIARI